jgi:hypothetical protein
MKRNKLVKRKENEPSSSENLTLDSVAMHERNTFNTIRSCYSPNLNYSEDQTWNNLFKLFDKIPVE